MLLHEKMRLQRKINRLTLKQLHFGNISDRMQKKVDKREKYYSKLEKQIERQANAYKNSMNMRISAQYGLGINGANMGLNGGTNGCLQQILSQWNGENKYSGSSYRNDVVQAILSGQYKTERVANDDKSYTNKYTINGNTSITEEEYNAAQAAIQSANGAVSQMQAQANYMKQCYEQNVSIWEEAAKEQLDAQREWEMDLLAEEQADMEAEKDSIDAQLQLAQERKKNIESMLQQSIQDSAPKFGLG